MRWRRGRQAGPDLPQQQLEPSLEEFGRRVKIYIVHFGGGVSGHIKLVPQFLDWVEQG